MQTDPNAITLTQDSISTLLLRLNIPLSSYRDFPHHMLQALKTIGEFSHHDRIHIIEIHHNMTFSVAYEWYDKRVSPIPDKWKHDHIISSNAWENQLSDQNYITILKGNEQAPEILSLLQEQDCQQMLLLPLFESGSQLTFIVFMQCKETHEWSPEEIRILADLASVVATQLDNYQLFSQLLRHVKRYQEELEPIEIIHSRLKRLHEDLLPAWKQIKENHPQLTELSNLDEHITTFNKICHIISDK